MATPRGNTYIVASGRGVYAGLPGNGAALGQVMSAVAALFAGGASAPPPDVRTALIGDSLTTHLLGYNWSPFFWINGLAAKGAQQLVANAGVSGDTVANMLARVNNAYTNASPGLAGLSPLGLVYVRAGTNDARNNTAIASLSSGYTSLLNAIKAYCQRVIILSVPPIGPTEGNFAQANARTIEYNAWLAAFAAANPSGFTFVDDSVNLRNPDGSQKTGYFNADGIHNDGRATWQQGVDGAAALQSLFNSYGYPSPLSADPADVYPAQPQWIPNHVMAGAGPVATGWSIGGYGSGFAMTNSIVAADVGDPNPTPWQRVSPTQVGYTGAGEALLITSPMSGRSVSASDPTALDIMVEIRFNAFDTRPFKWSRIMVFSTGSSQPITFDLDLKMGGEASITHGSVVVRHKMPRATFFTEGAGVSLRWEWATRFAYTGSMGSFDFRCFTVRG